MQTLTDTGLVLDKPAELHAQIKARKERLKRFEMAAMRHQNKNRQEANVQQVEALESVLVPREPHRREYETKRQHASNTSIVSRVLLVVSREYNFAVSEILAKNQHAEYVLPRYVAIGLLLELTRMSLPSIGRAMGGLHHTTIINARRRFARLIEGEAFRNRFDYLKAQVVGS